MITLEQAKNLKHGDVLIAVKDSKRWRVSGAVKTWKRDASRVQVPLKHGLYRHDYLTEQYLNDVTLETRTGWEPMKNMLDDRASQDERVPRSIQKHLDDQQNY